MKAFLQFVICIVFSIFIGCLLSSFIVGFCLSVALVSYLMYSEQKQSTAPQVHNSDNRKATFNNNDFLNDSDDYNPHKPNGLKAIDIDIRTSSMFNHSDHFNNDF